MQYLSDEEKKHGEFIDMVESLKLAFKGNEKMLKLLSEALWTLSDTWEINFK